MVAVFTHNFLTHESNSRGFRELLGVENPRSFEELFKLVHEDSLYRYYEEQGLFLENIEKTLEHTIKFTRANGSPVLLKLEYEATFDNTIVTYVKITHRETKTAFISNYDI